MSDAPRRGVRELAPKRSFVRTALRIYFRMAVGFALAVVLARWGWSRYGESRLESELARYRAAGEIIDPSDFDQPAPPDDQNAAVDLIAAGELIDGWTEAWKPFRRLELALPLDEVEMFAIEGVVQSSRDALRRLEVATSKPKVHLKDAYESPTATKRPAWWALRGELVPLLRAAALRSHQLGDDREAMLRVRQLLLVASALDQVPSLYANSVACGFRGAACDVLLQIAPDLRVGSASSGDVAAADVRATVDELMDDEARRRAIVRSLKGERVSKWDHAKAYADGRAELFGNAFTVSRRNDSWGDAVAPRLIQWALRPFALNDAPIIIEHYTRLIDAAGGASNWPELRASTPDLSGPREVREYPMLHLVAEMSVGRAERPLQYHFQALTEQHLAATALAIRCFAADHAGRIPLDLDELVPTYLSTLPTDPMANGGRRLGYVPDAADPILYSVGNDGTDDGGNGQPIYKGRRYTDGRLADWRTHDVVIHLCRQPRVVPEPIRR